jgi:hypothetical protein
VTKAVIFGLEPLSGFLHRDYADFAVPLEGGALRLLKFAMNLGKNYSL